MMDDALSRLQQIGKEAVLKEQAKMIASEFYSNELSKQYFLSQLYHIRRLMFWLIS